MGDTRNDGTEVMPTVGDDASETNGRFDMSEGRNPKSWPGGPRSGADIWHGNARGQEEMYVYLVEMEGGISMTV